MDSRRLTLDELYARAATDLGAFVGQDAAREIGVVVPANTSVATSSDFAIHLLDPTFPLTPKPAVPAPHTTIELPAADLPGSPASMPWTARRRSG